MFPSPPAKILDMFGLVPLFSLYAKPVSTVTGTRVTVKIILYFEDSDLLARQYIDRKEEKLVVQKWEEDLLLSALLLVSLAQTQDLGLKRLPLCHLPMETARFHLPLPLSNGYRVFVASRGIFVWVAFIIKGSTVHSDMNTWKTVQREVTRMIKG